MGFFARFSNASPVLSLELEPSVIGVEVEDRIANPASASSASSSVAAAASSSSGGSILDDLVPSIIGVEVEDRIANPASSSASSSSGVGSIGDIFAPDVTSVDVKGEERTHRDDAAEEEDKLMYDGCVGEGCA